MHVECLRSLGRARVRWCGFAMTVAEMRPPAVVRYRFLARAETCAPERGLAKQKPHSPGFWACIDFDCNIVLDFRPGRAVQRPKTSCNARGNSCASDRRAVVHENRCKPLHSPYDVTALRAKRATCAVSLLHATARATYARWRRADTVSSRHRRE